MHVDTQVSLVSDAEQPPDAESTVPLNFRLSLTIANPCSSSIEIRAGSFVKYTTNFPSLAGGTPQPSTCLAGKQPFGGLAAPAQKTVFAFDVSGCFASAAGDEPPTLTIEGGTVVLGQGAELPVPASTHPLR